LNAIVLLFLGILPFVANARLLRPPPAFFSQISGFQAEWCSPRLCYGKARFSQHSSVRAILVRDGQGALYVEDQWPKVDLLKPRFGVIGPVGNPSVSPEMGQAALTFDGRGEVDSVTLMVPSFGTLVARRL
jgi:hypothetical protein